MRGALVGYGTIASGHHEAHLAMRDVRIAAVADPIGTRRDAARRRDPRVSTYESLRELLDSGRVDFVDVCSPPAYHLDHQLAALDAECHVVCEKPFLLSTSDFLQLIEKLRGRDRVVYPSHNYKFSPVIRHLLERVQSPDFGTVVTGRFRTSRLGHARGVEEWEPHWRRMPQYSGGGILQDHGPHSVYLAGLVANATADSVSCTVANIQPKGFDDTEDTASLCIQFAGGFEARMDLTWAAQERLTSYEVTGTPQTIVVENDKTTIWDGGAPTRHVIPSDFDDPSHKA
jgi:predicted dehydrogenase